MGESSITFLNGGGRYDPAGNSWQAISTNNVQNGRLWHTAIWTGVEMIVWGGYDGVNFFNDGGRIVP